MASLLALGALALVAGCGGGDDEPEDQGADSGDPGRPDQFAAASDRETGVEIRVRGTKVTVIYRPEALSIAERAEQVACASARPGGKLDTARAELRKGTAKALHTATLPRDISDGMTLCQLEAGPEEDLATVLFKKP